MTTDPTPGPNGCPLCGSTEYPHSHNLGIVLNSRYYCADGQEHQHVTKRRLLRKWQWCNKCGEWQR